MADHSAIQWTDASWTVVTGCDRVSPGCANCYALTMAPRLKAMGNPGYQRDGDPKTSGPGFGVTLNEDRLDWPLRWKKPRRVFTTSMGDLFHPEVPDEFLDRVFAVMALAPQHTFQVLTKRPERMREYMTATWGDGYTEPVYDRSDPVFTAGCALLGNPPMDDPRRHALERALATWPLPNVWLGTSVENARWRTRIDELRKTPAAVRFLSCEPLLGSLTDWTKAEVTPRELGRLFFDLTGIGWVIVGGESGKGARPLDEQWVRDIVAECRRQGVAPFVKQMGAVWASEHLGRAGHGGDIETFPPDLRIREYPKPIDSRTE